MKRFTIVLVALLLGVVVYELYAQRGSGQGQAPTAVQARNAAMAGELPTNRRVGWVSGFGWESANAMPPLGGYPEFRDFSLHHAQPDGPWW